LSRDANQRVVDQEKRVKIPSNRTLEWSRSLGTRATGLRQAV
jgi:hypothetical protein